MDRYSELRAFSAVVETGGFSAAARRLGETQSAVSKAVGALEKRLGVLLFNRSTRRVTLTDQGQRYYERIKPAVDEIDAADNEMTSTLLEVTGLIRIAAPSSFGRLHIMPLLPELLSRNPGLQVDLVLSDYVRDMVEDRIDLAIRISPGDDPDSVVRHVARGSLVCVGSRRYFERHGLPKSPAELSDHNCLVYGGLTDWPFVGPEGRYTVAVRGNLSSNSVETIRAGVLADVGIGIFQSSSLIGELMHPDMITVLGEFMDGERDVSLVWPRRHYVSARVRRVTEFFTEALPKRL
jgi:DNA-binding transcriptional LysR family regulator